MFVFGTPSIYLISVARAPCYLPLLIAFCSAPGAGVGGRNSTAHWHMGHCGPSMTLLTLFVAAGTQHRHVTKSYGHSRKQEAIEGETGMLAVAVGYEGIEIRRQCTGHEGQGRKPNLYCIRKRTYRRYTLIGLNHPNPIRSPHYSPRPRKGPEAWWDT
jgi:hypothetical protein